MNKLIGMLVAATVGIVSAAPAHANGLNMFGRILQMAPRLMQQHRPNGYPNTAHNPNCGGSWGEGCWTPQAREQLYRSQGLLPRRGAIINYPGAGVVGNGASVGQGSVTVLVAHPWTGHRVNGVFVCDSGPCPRNGALGD